MALHPPPSFSPPASLPPSLPARSCSGAIGPLLRYLRDHKHNDAALRSGLHTLSLLVSNSPNRGIIVSFHVGAAPAPPALPRPACPALLCFHVLGAAPAPPAPPCLAPCAALRAGVPCLPVPAGVCLPDTQQPSTEPLLACTPSNRFSAPAVRSLCLACLQGQAMLCEAMRATQDLEIRENIVQLLWDLEAHNRECRFEPGGCWIFFRWAWLCVAWQASTPALPVYGSCRRRRGMPRAARLQGT